jgi:hypothetical protein
MTKRLKDSVTRFKLPLVEADQNRVIRNAANGGPLGNELGFSVNREPAGIRTIAGVFLHRDPANIFRRVRPIVINAMQLVVRWTRRHVSDEVLECQPTFANKNPAPAIARIVLGVRVVASRHHAVPNRVKAMIAANDPATAATATYRATGPKIDSRDSFLRPAFTMTPPVIHLIVWVRAYYRPFAKRFADHCGTRCCGVPCLTA